MPKKIVISVTIDDRHMVKLNAATKAGLGNRSQVVRLAIEHFRWSGYSAPKPKKGRK